MGSTKNFGVFAPSGLNKPSRKLGDLLLRQLSILGIKVLVVERNVKFM